VQPSDFPTFQLITNRQSAIENRKSPIELESRHTSGLYHKRPVALVRGQGARVWDAEGREYIDCVGGHGVANVGHANPYVVQAIREQAERLIICSESFYNDRRAELLSELTRIAPPGLERAFLCNSGTEAIEGAIKFARLAQIHKHAIFTIIFRSTHLLQRHRQYALALFATRLGDDLLDPTCQCG